MHIATRLAHIESVEDLFELLGVPSDPRVLAVHRLRILRRFGAEMTVIVRSAPDAPEAALLAQYAAALTSIHEQCARGLREPEPVFRGLGQQLVQLRRGPTSTTNRGQ